MVGCCSVARLCLTLCNPVDCSMPGLPVHTVLGFLVARILKRFAISSSGGPRFVRTLHYDSSSLGGMAHSFVELCKPPHNNKTVICVSCSVMSNCLHPMVCPWNSPGKNSQWVAIPFSWGSSQTRDQTRVSSSVADSLPSELPENTYRVRRYNRRVEVSFAENSGKHIIYVRFHFLL